MKKKEVWLIIALAVECVLIVALLCCIGKFNAEKKAWVEQKKEAVELSSIPTVTPTVIQEEKPTEEEIYQTAVECLHNYRTMIGEYFMSFPISGTFSSEDFETINGVAGYVLVEKFSTLQAVKDYIETICTKEHAEELYYSKWGWDLNGECPYLAEMNGRLYAQVADTTFGGGIEEIPLAVMDSEGNIVFVYRYTHEEGKDDYSGVEEGTIVLEKQDGKWYVKSVSEWK